MRAAGCRFICLAGTNRRPARGPLPVRVDEHGFPFIDATIILPVSSRWRAVFSSMAGPNLRDFTSVQRCAPCPARQT